jgi:uracil-DNA glycosylase family 4
MTADGDRRFDELCSKVAHCTRCVRMEQSARVLSRAAGPLSAPIMFIGEAPGRLGADTTEIPFHGDVAGHNFEALLVVAGLDRTQVFVTNAVLCNPKDASGNNATPQRNEVANCNPYLREQIDLVQPRIVATLGATALEATRSLATHSLRLAQDVRTSAPWYDRLLVPLYHPGARGLVHRSLLNQRSDFQFLGELLARHGRATRRVIGRTRTDVSLLAGAILRRSGPTTYFALHKVFYLLEWEAVRKLGRRLSAAFFLRQKDGPYCTDLHLTKLRRAIPELAVSGDLSKPTLRLPQGSLFASDASLPTDVIALLDDVVGSVASLTDGQLKTRVYLTEPMRRLIRIEKTHLVNLYNSPIDLQSSSIDERPRSARDSKDDERSGAYGEG